jgi:2'-5' RNA ligase
VYSLNVPVPGALERLSADLHPKLLAFDSIRERQTLTVKRFETGRADTQATLDHLRARLRPVLAGTPAFEARVGHIDYFADPPEGPAPVVYLAVESPELVRLHDRLVTEFGAVDGLEGEDYVSHVTLARGGDLADARRLAETEIDPVTWTVSELVLWSGKYQEVTQRIPLPA